MFVLSIHDKKEGSYLLLTDLYGYKFEISCALDLQLQFKYLTYVFSSTALMHTLCSVFEIEKIKNKKHLALIHYMIS